jgi:endonuclease G
MNEPASIEKIDQSDSSDNRRRVALLYCGFSILFLGLGVMVYAAAVFASLKSDSHWIKGVPPLVTFLFVIASVFFSVKKDTWLVDAVRRASLWFQDRIVILFLVALATSAAAVFGGLFVWKAANSKDGQLVVRVFKDAPVREQALPDIPVQFDNQLKEELIQRVTDSRGQVQLDANASDVYSIEIRQSKEEGALRTIIDPAAQINVKDTKQNLRQVLFGQIVKDAWIKPSGSDSDTENLHPFAFMPESFFRWQSKGLPQTMKVEANSLTVPFALPGAETIIHRKAYVVGFSPQLRLPRWVVYKVVPGATVPRRTEIERFYHDPDLPAVQQLDDSAYRQNDYDRGHLIRRADVVGLGETELPKINYFTVVVPQLAFVNRQSWSSIERHTSAQADAGANVYVIRGPMFSTKDGQPKVGVTFIGPQAAPVPTHFFQISLVQTNGSRRVEAFVVPNTYVDMEGGDISRFRTSVDAISKATGLEFESSLRVSDL